MITRITTVALLAAVLLPAVALADTPITTGVSADVNVTAGVGAGTASAGASANAGASATVSAKQVTTAKNRADTEISRRIAALNDLATRMGSLARVSAEFKTSITATIQAQISALTSLKSKVDADLDIATLKADIQSITKSYRIFALVLPQGRIAAAADRATTIASMENALAAKLQARVEALPAGSDASAVTAALADLSAKTSDANAKAQAAVTATASLQPDNGDATAKAANEAALKEARADIQAAQQDLVAARKDITTATQGLKKLGASASASASTTVTQ